jgi:hypothetical protein
MGGDGDGGGGPGGDAAAASESAQRQADWQWWAIGVVVLAIGVVAGAWLKDDAGGPVFELNAGISVFALLFVAAQAIERLAENCVARAWDRNAVRRRSIEMKGSRPEEEQRRNR